MDERKRMGTTLRYGDGGGGDAAEEDLGHG